MSRNAFIVAATAPNQPQPAVDRPQRELRGAVERDTYQNPENRNAVARLASQRTENETCVLIPRTSGAISTEPGR